MPEIDNLASGVLRGTWGVEPVYGATAFLAGPISFDIKRGTPPGTNDLDRYTDQAMEFQAPISDQGGPVATTAHGTR